MTMKIEWLKSEWLKRFKEQRQTEKNILEFKYFVQRTNPKMLDFNDLIDDKDNYLKTILELEKSGSEKLSIKDLKGSYVKLKPVLSAEELNALLSAPPSDNVKIDAYFPLRIWILVVASAFWFVRLSVFTSEVAADLFSNPAVREFMVPALYFRAWVVIVSITLVLWSYKNTKFPAIAFGFIFVASIFNLFFDISIFYNEKLAYQDTRTTLYIAIRIFFSYMLFISMRNAKRIPSGNDKWNILLPLKKHDQIQS